jgi:putative glutamine amidotransferase
MLGITHLAVNSSHHQSVGDNLGADIIISAKSPEGIVEAIEVQTKKFTLGVQWHPEDLSATDSNHAVIFEGFINAALSFLC